MDLPFYTPVDRLASASELYEVTTRCAFSTPLGWTSDNDSCFKNVDLNTSLDPWVSLHPLKSSADTAVDSWQCSS